MLCDPQSSHRDLHWDRQKFIEIYEKYHVQMERTAMRILKEQSDVEDAVQNAFMQMIRHFEKIFEIPCEELPFWIISIVKNEARAILRKNSRTVSLEDWDGFAEHMRLQICQKDMLRPNVWSGPLM